MRSSTGVRALTFLSLGGVALAALACGGCSTSRTDKANYDERQQIRKDGQTDANKAAGQGRSDLDRATSGDGK